MNKYPYHNASDFLASGISLKRIGDVGSACHPVAYAHQDDYYIFGILEKGIGRGMIDLVEYNITEGEAFLVQPGQVHSLVSSEKTGGWILFVDSSLVGNKEKIIFDSFSLHTSSFKIDASSEADLLQLAGMLARRINSVDKEMMKTDNIVSKNVIIRLVQSFVAIIAGAAQNLNNEKLRFSQRKVEIVLKFCRLLEQNIAACHQVSFYASRLNISTAYLNEIVKEVTGLSSSAYIKGELALLAKRLLVGSSLSVKEVAFRLGFDDCAYFTRFFTQTVGMSPTKFRQRCLE